MTLITYSSCPCCGADKIGNLLAAQDYTVSKERFEIWQCENCTARFTQHVPDQSSISRYYQSEEYISHTDTKKGLINSLYHLVRRRTLRHKQLLVEKYCQQTKGSLLDLGAGTGAFAAHMK